MIPAVQITHSKTTAFTQKVQTQNTVEDIHTMYGEAALFQTIKLWITQVSYA